MTLKHTKTNNIAAWTQPNLDAQIALGNFPLGTLIADIVLSTDWNTDHVNNFTNSIVAADGAGSQVAVTVGSGLTYNTGTKTLTATGGGGTVTDVSVVTANGVSGSVATSTTTPAITISLGAITPTSVAASGTVTGSNLSGSNTGDQTSVSGNAGSATNIAITDDNATNATMLPMWVTTNTGNLPAKVSSTKITFNPSTANLTTTTFTGALAGNATTATTLATGRTIAITGDLTYTSPAFNGSANVTAAGTIANSAVTLAKMADVATGTVFYRKTAATGIPEVQTLATLKTDLGLTGTNSGDQTITLTSDVTGSGTGSFATTIAAQAVTNSKLANVATATFKGRTTAATGSPEDLTVTQATALLNVFGADAGAGGVRGLVPATVAGDSAKYLKGDGTWASVAGSGTVTTVSVVSANGFAGTVANPTTTPAITLTTPITGVLKGNGTAISAAAAGTDYVGIGSITSDGITMNTARILGRTTAASGAVEEITIGSNLTLAAGVLSATAGGGISTGKVVAIARGFAMN